MDKRSPIARVFLTERSSAEEVREQAARVEACLFPHPITRQLLDGIPGSVVVLNQHRQIVFANQTLLTVLAVKDLASIRGMLPGEALRCAHASESRGCGSTEFCGRCGLARAVLLSLAGSRHVDECRIMKAGPGDAYDLLTQTTPFAVDGQSYVFVALHDISDQKRRRSLERVFFHDVLNMAGAVWGLTGVLQETGAEQSRKLAGDIHAVSGRLIDEIKAQRELLSAENSDLRIETREISSIGLLSEVLETAKGFDVAEGKRMVIAGGGEDVLFRSDPVQLGRVLNNMLKNALEASEAGDTVTAGVKRMDGGIKFCVHNPAVMSRDVRLQVFQRSFSTKAANRGTGTYSIKLLSERYLGGRVGFRSVDGEGTTFYGIYPLTLAPLPARASSSGSAAK